MLRTSVVVPTYQRRAFLPRLLPALLGDPALYECVVVVDGARDGSLEFLQEVASEDPRLIPVFVENRGEDGARMAGVERARGEIVLLLDDDVEAEPGLVSAHQRHHAAADRLVVVGYMPVVDPQGVGPGLYADRYEDHCRRWREHPDQILDTFWAGNVSLWRRDYLRVAATPSRYRYDFHADRAFGFRCLEAGLNGVFDPACRARHHYARSVDGLSRDARNQGLSLVRLHDEYPARSPDLAADQFTWFLPSYQVPFVNLCKRPRAAATAAALLCSLTRAVDRAGAPKAREVATLMMTVERQTGAINARRQLAA
jgi:glycosyltransferase involved in cell wall biosynthesis